MSESLLRSIQSLLQDIVAPEVRETKARVESLSHEMATRFDLMQNQMDQRFEAIEKLLGVHMGGIEKQMAQQERLLLSAFAESQLRTEISGAKSVVDLRERVAVLESKAA